MIPDDQTEEPSQEQLDEDLAEKIADAILERASRPGIGRLVAMQMAGIAKDPPSQEDLAAAFGLKVGKISELENRALLFIEFFHPDLRDELRSLPSEVLRGGEGARHSAE